MHTHPRVPWSPYMLRSSGNNKLLVSLCFALVVPDSRMGPWAGGICSAPPQRQGRSGNCPFLRVWSFDIGPNGQCQSILVARLCSTWNCVSVCCPCRKEEKLWLKQEQEAGIQNKICYWKSSKFLFSFKVTKSFFFNLNLLLSLSIY